MVPRNKSLTKLQAFRRQERVDQQRRSRPIAVLVLAAAVVSACSSSTKASDSVASSTSGGSTTTPASSTTVAGVVNTTASSVDPGSDVSTTTSGSVATTQPLPRPCGPKSFSFPKELYPFTDRCIDLAMGDYHYFDESPTGTPKGTVLMVHGNPTSSFIYRDVAQQLLKDGYRVVAPDHYGFGESAKPSPDKFGYTPSDHSRILDNFVTALDLNDVTLLVQDWGGPIGLGMAVDQPERIRNLVVMNTWAWQVSPADAKGPFWQLASWSQQNQGRAEDDATNGLIVQGAAIALGLAHQEPLTTKVKDTFTGPFFDPATQQLRSPRVIVPASRFARSIFNDTAMFKKLGDLGPIAKKPVYFFTGGSDPLFGALLPNPDGTCIQGKPATIDKATRCADSTGRFIYPYIERFSSLWQPDMIKGTTVIDASGHFVQEDRPQQLADAVNKLNAK
jgi:pimeloyl-ACP methyl ester carboxylesterase